MTDCSLYLIFNIKKDSKLNQKTRELQKSFYKNIENAHNNIDKRNGPLGFYHKNHITIITLKIHSNQSYFNHLIKSGILKKFFEHKIKIFSNEKFEDTNTFKLFGQNGWFLVNELNKMDDTKITEFRTDFYNYLDALLKKKKKGQVTKSDGKRKTYLDGTLVYTIPEYTYGKNNWNPHISIVNQKTIEFTSKKSKYKLSELGNIYKSSFEKKNYITKPIVSDIIFAQLKPEIGKFNFLDQIDEVTISLNCSKNNPNNIEDTFELNKFELNKFDPNKIYKLLKNSKYIDIGYGKDLIETYGHQNIKFT